MMPPFAEHAVLEYFPGVVGGLFGVDHAISSFSCSSGFVNFHFLAKSGRYSSSDIKPGEHIVPDRPFVLISRATTSKLEAIERSE